MRSWQIPVCWEMCGMATIEADTLEEAVEIARDDDGNIPLPDDAYYVDGSWDLSYDDVEGIRACHNNGQPDEIVKRSTKT